MAIKDPAVLIELASPVDPTERSKVVPDGAALRSTVVLPPGPPTELDARGPAVVACAPAAPLTVTVNDVMPAGAVNVGVLAAVSKTAVHPVMQVAGDWLSARAGGAPRKAPVRPTVAMARATREGTIR